MSQKCHHQRLMVIGGHTNLSMLSMLKVNNTVKVSGRISCMNCM